MLCIIRKLTAIYCNLRLRHVVYYWILVLLGRMGIWHTEVSFIDLFKSVGLLLSFLQLLLNLPVPSLFKCLTNIYYCFLLICCSLKVLYFHYFCVCCNMKVAFFCLFVEVLVQLGFFFFFLHTYAMHCGTWVEEWLIKMKAHGINDTRQWWEGNELGDRSSWIGKLTVLIVPE